MGAGGTSIPQKRDPSLIRGGVMWGLIATAAAGIAVILAVRVLE